MNIIGGIELLSYCIYEETMKNQEMNIPIKNEDVFCKPIMFYAIDAVFPCTLEEEDKNCYVTSGGIEYYIAESYQSVNSKIRERQTFLIN